ncbi:M3 family metallopeptidase [soil metagenome]
MKNPAKFFILGFCIAFIFIARQNEAIGIPKTILSDEKPALSSHNPLMPEPGELFDFAKVNVEVIKTAATYTENKVTMLLAQINAAEGNRTFSNTMMPLDETYNTLQKLSSVYQLISNTSTDKEIRDVAGEMLAKFSTLTDQLLQNESLYAAVKNYSISAEAKTLIGERSFFVKQMMKQFALNGMSLTTEKRDTLKKYNSTLNDLGIAFNKNISEDKSKVVFAKNELEGLQEDFINSFRLPAPDLNYSFDLSTPTYITFMSDCKNAKSRRKLYMAKMNVGGKANEKLLVEILNTRSKKAKLLGFKTYSQYATSDIMSQNTENVWKFEKGLSADLREKAIQDHAALQSLKSAELASTVQQGPHKSLALQAEYAMNAKQPLYPYDVMYYSNRLLKENYNVDNEKVKEYFEMKNVISGIFTVYQKLYNLRFIEDLNASTWHKEVKAYTVFDNATNERIGYFYLDLYPRADKYNHFACFGLTGSKKFENGKKQLKAAALVCNFPPPAADKPSLLPHSQVSTFFHEFGHLIHVLLSETELAYFAGTNVATDFVEAPSQIMENWIWEKDVLSLFATHYKTGQIIPDTLLNNMIKARNLNSGLNMLQQVYYGTLDFTLNDGMKIDSAGDIYAKAKELQNSITLYPFVEGTHFAGTFGHLTGYGSKYYGYLWSLVYASDMYSEFDKKGPLNPEVGKRYREKVLAKGGSDDALNLVRNFLGREPNNQAFLKQIGLGKK